MSLEGLRKAVLEVKPYVPGKSIEQVMAEKGLKDVIKLGSNENPYGPFTNARKVMKEEVDFINTYPDVSFYHLKERLSGIHGVKSENICISHGAEGMLQTLGKAFIDPGDEVIIPGATYNLYREISRVMGANIVSVPMNENYYIDLEAVAGKISSKTKLLWLSNPNNPTGTVFDKKSFERLVESLPSHVWVVLDEAYAEFTTQDILPDVASLIEGGANVISIRTFSKAYGLAGGRLGYAICREEMATAIDTVTEPFNANRIVVVGALATLEKDKKEYAEAIEKIKKGRQWLTAEFRRLGLSPVESHTNFVFADTPLSAARLSEKLLDLGIIVRPCDNWGFPRAVRFTVGLEQQNQRLIKGISDILEACAEEVKQ
jgi:histidinol-phosphate aminotransferase